jgi:hypothetical protein
LLSSMWFDSVSLCTEAHVSAASRAKQNAKTSSPSVPVLAACCFCRLGSDKSARDSTACDSCPVRV